MPSTSWIPDLVPGAGFDSLLGEAKQEGVAGELEVQAGAAGQDGDTSFRLLETTEEFDSELGISSELKVGFGAFGGNAKFSFKERNKVSSQATFCVIRVFALNAYQPLRRPKLTEPAWTLLKNGNKDRFRERFGDFYVSGQRTGVEFYGVIRIEAESVQTQKEIAASIQASYGLAVSGRGSVNYNENMSSSKHEIEASTFQKGGRVALAITLDQLVTQARDALEQSRSGEGFPFAMELDRYSELELPNDDAHPLDIAAAQENIEAMATHTQELKRMRNEIDFVLRHQDWFENPSVPALNAINQQIAQQLEELRKRAKICATEFVACQYYAPTYPELILPARKAGIAPPPPSIRVPNFTGWNDVDLEFIRASIPGYYSVEDWIAGRPESDQGQPPVYRPRDLIEFLASSIEMKIDLLPGAVEGNQNRVVRQDPAAGTMITVGQRVVLQAGP